MKKILFFLCVMVIGAFAFIPLSCGDSPGLKPTSVDNYDFYDYDGDGNYDYWFLRDDDGNVIAEGYYPDDYPYTPNTGTGTNNSIHQTGTNNNTGTGNQTGTNNNTGTGNQTGTNNNTGTGNQPGTGNQTGTGNNNTGVGGQTGGSSGWDDYPASGQGTVHPYPFPSGMTKYTNISVSAGGHSIDLYSVRANNTHQWDINAQQLCDQLPVAMFDISGGAVTVEVTVNSAANVQIRPKSLNINPTINGNKISFSLPKPGQYSVEWNNQPNNPKNAVLIFANPYEDFTAIAASPKTKVYDTGVHMLPGQGLFVGEGQTILLKPGAVLRGRVRFYQDPETWPHDGPANNSKIVGRGIIDGSHLQDSISAETILPIQTVGVNNVEINGISIFDPNGWTIELKFSSNIKIYNMKMVTSRCNSDGITIQTTNGVTVENSFLRTWDDGVVVKNYEMPSQYTNTFSQDISVKNCIFWTDLAQSMEIGFETNKFGLPNPTIKNVKFENITVFHALHKPPISIHNGDNAAISNVTFKNIVIENFQCGEGDGWQYLIDFTNVKGGEVAGTASSWTTVSTRGSISDVTVENVQVLAGKTPGARFMNSVSGGSINNITVKNITNQGAPLNLSSGIRPGGTVNVNFQ